MKHGSILSLGLGAIFCASLLSLACSSDNGGSPPDAGKKGSGGTGGKGGSGGSLATGGSSATGGSGGASARGGSGGSSTGGSGGASGGASGSGGSAAGGAGGSSLGGTSGSGGSSAAGGATGSGGSSMAGGATGTGGSAAGGAGGTGTGGSTEIDGGNGSPVDGSAVDVMEIDAEDAPAPENDVPAGEDTGAQSDIVPVLLDSGGMDVESVDMEPIDTMVVLLDAEVDTRKADLGPDVSDLAKDAPADMASDKADAGSCLQQIVVDGYAAGGHACSACQTSQPTPTSLESQCTGMIDCLVSARCQSPSAGNCWVDCRNQVNGAQIDTETCVLAIVNAACQ